MSNEIKIPLTGDNKELKKTLDASAGDIRAFVAQVAVAFAPIAVAFGGFLAAKRFIDAQGEAIKAANESIEAQAKLDTVLKSTGNTTGFTSEQLAQLAGDLQLVTKFGDEATMNLESLLATFSNVRGDVFKEAAKITQDLAEFKGMDLSSAGFLIGKALNEPVEGLAALQRIIGKLSDEQEKAIAKAVEFGDVQRAQVVIIDALKNKFGGLAEEMARVGSGPAAVLANRFGEIQETFGKAFKEIKSLERPFKESFATVLENIAPLVLNAAKEFKKFAVEILTTLQPVFDFLKDGFNKAFGFVLNVASYIAPVIKDVVRFIAASINQLPDILRGVFTWIVDKAIDVFAAIEAVVMNWQGVVSVATKGAKLEFLHLYEDLKDIFGETGLGYINKFFTTVGIWWKEHGEYVVSILRLIQAAQTLGLSEMGAALAGYLNDAKKQVTEQQLTINQLSPAMGMRKLTEEEIKLTKELAAETAALRNNLGNSFNDSFTRTKDTLTKLLGTFDFFAKHPPEVPINLDPKLSKKPFDIHGDDGKEKKDKADKEFKPWFDWKKKDDDKDKDKGTDNKGKIEDLLSLNRRITEAAAGETGQGKLLKGIQQNLVVGIERAAHGVKQVVDAIGNLGKRLQKDWPNLVELAGKGLGFNMGFMLSDAEKKKRLEDWAFSAWSVDDQKKLVGDTWKTIEKMESSFQDSGPGTDIWSLWKFQSKKLAEMQRLKPAADALAKQQKEMEALFANSEVSSSPRQGTNLILQMMAEQTAIQRQSLVEQLRISPHVEKTADETKKTAEQIGTVGGLY